MPESRPKRFSIFDVPDLTESQAAARVHETLRAIPHLTHIYDDSFVDHIARRRDINNYLLWLLAQTDGQYGREYLSSLVGDLDLLEDEGAYSSFADKLRKYSKFDFEGARSELDLTAWMKRRGVPVTIEPPTRGDQNCDFLAETNIRTWWEVKSVRDLDFFLEDEVVAREVQALLQRIDEPYILSLLPSDVSRNDVRKAARSLKRQFADHHRASASIPATFEAYGLRVKVTEKTSKPYGYLGILQTAGYTWGDEFAKRARNRILKAVDQLPDDGAGIVVVDTTVSTWAEEEDIVGACFGPEIGIYRDGQMFSCRDTQRGAFKANERKRISAVIHYSRSPRETTEPRQLTIYHNPFARHSIEDDVLSGAYVRQFRRVETQSGSYRIQEV